ncbi:MAG: hypothetical protein Pg6B_09860 [Candidatus Azobacteroides pseudotrichonymphae]|nr:MAG: hypothetical protein Pg6B_09860 [Candidatus Azobacteroides pseudotrichonymphae]
MIITGISSNYHLFFLTLIKNIFLVNLNRRIYSIFYKIVSEITFSLRDILYILIDSSFKLKDSSFYFIVFFI